MDAAAQVRAVMTGGLDESGATAADWVSLMRTAARHANDRDDRRRAVAALERQILGGAYTPEPPKRLADGLAEVSPQHRGAIVSYATGQSLGSVAELTRLTAEQAKEDRQQAGWQPSVRSAA
jgi:hypothetical protein